MATKGDYLVNNTVEDCATLLAQLNRVSSTKWRIVNRMVGVGAAELDGYAFANDYTKAKFIDLYTELNNLPDFVVDNNLREQLFDLLSSVQ